MQIYLVGGAVRDKLLKIDTKEKDYVVVGSNRAEMLALGFKQVGNSFPVFLHPKTKEEYALARTEKKQGVGYRGFTTNTQNISLKEDLKRRDLTINSMAIDNKENLIDYFGGVNDLNSRVLRHTSSFFAEDPVRVLRVARFSAKFKDLGFTIAHSTKKMLKKMVLDGGLEHIVAERLLLETTKALAHRTPSEFFKTLVDCGAYCRVFSIDEKKQTYSDFSFLDYLNVNTCIKFALWLSGYDLTCVTKVTKKLKVSNRYKNLSVMVVKFKKTAINFSKMSPENKLAFFVNTDSFRKKQNFVELLEVFKLLNIKTDDIYNTFVGLQKINFDKKAANGVKKLKQDMLEFIKK